MAEVQTPGFLAWPFFFEGRTFLKEQAFFVL